MNTNRSEDSIAHAVARLATADAPHNERVGTAFGGHWVTTDRGAWQEHRLSAGAALRGARSISFAEYPLSKQKISRLAIELRSDSPRDRDIAGEVRRAFGPWPPDQEPLPFPETTKVTEASELPLYNQVCRLGPRTVITINGYHDGRPNGIYVKWTR